MEKDKEHENSHWVDIWPALAPGKAWTDYSVQDKCVRVRAFLDFWVAGRDSGRFGQNQLPLIHECYLAWIGVPQPAKMEPTKAVSTFCYSNST